MTAELTSKQTRTFIAIFLYMYSVRAISLPVVVCWFDASFHRRVERNKDRGKKKIISKTYSHGIPSNLERTGSALFGRLDGRVCQCRTSPPPPKTGWFTKILTFQTVARKNHKCVQQAPRTELLKGSRIRLENIWKT